MHVFFLGFKFDKEEPHNSENSEKTALHNLLMANDVFLRDIGTQSDIYDIYDVKIIILKCFAVHVFIKYFKLSILFNFRNSNFTIGVKIFANYVEQENPYDH